MIHNPSPQEVYMEFKLLVMVNLCTRNIIQNEGQGISKAPALFLNKNKIMHCFPKFQVYKHIASKMRLSEIIVDWEISCLRADDHLVHAHLSHCLTGLPLWFALNYFCHSLLLFCLMHVCLQILFSYDIQINDLFLCHL